MVHKPAGAKVALVLLGKKRSKRNNAKVIFSNNRKTASASGASTAVTLHATCFGERSGVI